MKPPHGYNNIRLDHCVTAWDIFFEVWGQIQPSFNYVISFLREGKKNNLGEANINKTDLDQFPDCCKM